MTTFDLKVDTDPFEAVLRELAEHGSAPDIQNWVRVHHQGEGVIVLWPSDELMDALEEVDG